ncbi:bifunctional acetate--CoA ligase family protein/GNAT family N-acetyltransferase [Luteimonas sp. BDR2-5]|uniref:bifunctional acetate--CoA ligase family protein/GNAT family N-acetyltransferase n=1 Tax=Proluteimonas luteida TaxID=2878685 RepID=UPI001E2CDE50|nr:bifunctional acetate--CoA ligase family protein/GNAT family N-acetyltransferase [Luteimonas sp. BDR2-5]MCD9030052.1 bifunctional acetate--CoA ligase family protein/GNAT family N-acetyltransferase [Luteimonas sp. BDR2-5]
MSLYALDSVFRPASVAVVGASPRPRSLGRLVLQQLREGGFAGRIGLVNPRHAEIDGLAAVKSLQALPFAPELVVIAAPPADVAGVAAAAADKGAKAAIVLTRGLGRGKGSYNAALAEVARARGLRIVGPNCLGVIAPHAKLFASFAAHRPAAGDLALISQSGAVAAGMIEWSRPRGIGFSAVASLGDALDVDFADLLDYFATDRHTRAILLYVEHVRDARKFLSAARAAARAKPVVVVKPGRHARGSGEPQSHAAALASPDAVYDAAFRRAGLLRVHALDELFAAAETLAHLGTLPGKRLAVMTNGIGIGMLALDRLVDLGGIRAALSKGTLATLDAELVRGWSRRNAVDMLGDADGARYAATLEALLKDRDNDAVLVMQVPTVLSDPRETAEAVIRTLRAHPRETARKPIFAVWLGNDPKALATLGDAGIPTYNSEADAVRGFMYLVRHQEAQTALKETPPSLPADFVVDVPAARAVVDAALARGEEWLDPVATAALFAAYGIPLAPSWQVADADAAVQAAAPLLARGEAVAVKISSPDIPHKSDVDGVRLNLASPQAVHEAAGRILERAREARPDARIDGLTVHPMIVRPKARELIAGIADDPTFGPVIVFGRGGTAVEVIDDKALALPPLDLRLAHELIGRTRVSRILKTYRDVPAADERAVALLLVKLAQLAADIPEIRELDVNPLLADRDGVIALDARVAVAPSRQLHKGRGHPRFAIFPYPTEWERTITLSNGKSAFVRPVRPEDDALFRAFFDKVSTEDLRLRFFSAVRHFSHEFIARMTQLDYARSIALAAIDPDSGEMLGAVRLLADANYDTGEYGIMVRSDLKGAGLGWRLMKIMIEYAHWQGLHTVEGQVLRENTTMLAMCRQLGFSVSPDPDDATVAIVRLPVGAAVDPVAG